MDKNKRLARRTPARRISHARAALIAWHRDRGRHDLPWRGSHAPYAVLVSEFMLQQTTVSTVLPRFAAWMRRFPDIASLAAAGEQEVLAAWEGLGYYSRARRLHAAAQAIMTRHGGVIPSAEENLLALPGVGAYTAAAVRAFAFDAKAVVLDINIIRVLARWGAITTPIDKACGKNESSALAREFFPATGCRETASALMDLGAMLCTSGKPDCGACPLQATCLANDPERLPAKSPRRVATRVSEARAWIVRNGKLHLQQSAGPRWRGLWILPELGDLRPAGQPVAEQTYPITRYRVTMRLFPVAGRVPETTRGFTIAELADLPIPTPHRKAIDQALRRTAGDCRPGISRP